MPRFIGPLGMTALERINAALDLDYGGVDFAVNADGAEHRFTVSMTAFRELDFRRNDGLEVSLLWEPGSNTTRVTVRDDRHGNAFEIPVREGQRPLDVFHHPYAYLGT